MDDPLKSLEDSLAEQVKKEKAAEVGEARVRLEYAEWVRRDAHPALEAVAGKIRASGAGVEVEPVEDHDPPRAQIRVTMDRQPLFVYRLFLHPNTGPDQALVRKEYTKYNADYFPPTDRERTKIEEDWFFPANVQPAGQNTPDQITKEEIGRDVERLYMAHRKTDWTGYGY